MVAALVVASLCVPIHKVDEDAGTQALLVVQQSPGSKYQALIPLLNRLVVYTAAVFPINLAGTSKEKTELSLVQTMASAVGKPILSYQTEVPKADQILNTMMNVGNVIGTSVGFNPVILMTNVVGRADMLALVEELFKFPLEFANPSESQLLTAEQVMLTLGLSGAAQEEAIERFLNTLTKEQRASLDTLQAEIDKKFISKMVGPNGAPTPELVKEMQRQISMEEVAPSADEISQALIAIKPYSDPHPYSSESKFKEFLPLVKQVVIYTGVVLPSLEVHKQHKKNSELTELALLQSVAAAAGQKQDLESKLPSSEAMVDAMVAIGRVMGGSSGFNPVQLFVNTVGKPELQSVIDDLMRFPLQFPDPTEPQIMAAEQVVLSVGLGFGNQEESISNFINSLSPEQQSMIDKLEKDIVDKLMGSMMTPSGEPSLRLLQEIKREMKEMESRSGSSDQMPQEFKQMILEAAKMNRTVDELVQAQALVAVRGPADLVPEPLQKIVQSKSGLHDAEMGLQSLIALEPASKSGGFKLLLPLVNQVMIYSGVVLPSLKAKRENKRFDQLKESALLQTIVDAANSSIYVFEGDLPTASDMLVAMTAIGNVMGSSVGFNPVEIMTNVVGRDNMTAVIDQIVRFPFQFPDLTDAQLSRAESMLLSVGLGFMNQEQALDAFVASLDAKQKSMILSLQESIFGKLIGAMVMPNGQPTPALVEEIKKSMHVVSNKAI